MIILTDELFLNVAMTMPKSMANGPGMRAVIWVQGCTIGCPGCYNAFTHPHKIEKLVRPEDLADWINSIEGIEGITFSGGEPFEQSEAVANVIKLVKAKRSENLSVFIFTGFDLQFLQNSQSESVLELLSLADMLSAGPYLSSEHNSNLLWRGSNNQKLIYLSERYNQSNEKEWLKQSPVEELVLNNDTVKRTGFLGQKGHLKKLLEAMK